VLYYVADNRLSGKLETAIQALDNITKTYYSFVNAEPSSTLSTSAITPAGRYDAHLVPYEVLQQAQPDLRWVAHEGKLRLDFFAKFLIFSRFLKAVLQTIGFGVQRRCDTYLKTRGEHLIHHSLCHVVFVEWMT